MPSPNVEQCRLEVGVASALTHVLVGVAADGHVRDAGRAQVVKADGLRPGAADVERGSGYAGLHQVLTEHLREVREAGEEQAAGLGPLGPHLVEEGAQYGLEREVPAVFGLGPFVEHALDVIEGAVHADHAVLEVDAPAPEEGEHFAGAGVAIDGYGVEAAALQRDGRTTEKLVELDWEQPLLFECARYVGWLHADGRIDLE
ncbi:MAG: hypothetical protein WDO69_18935 [Pseudomonadota bacterium]